MAKPRIGIDARLFGLHDRGLGRYVAELASILRPLQDKFEFVMFVSPQNDMALVRALGYEAIVAPWQTYSWGEQWSYAKQLRAAHLDLMFFPHFNAPFFYRGPFVVTIHDLILHHFPDRRASTRAAIFYWLKYALYRLAIRATVSRAKHIVAVSLFTAEDLLTYYPEAEHRLTVIPEPPPHFTRLNLPNDKNSDVVYTMDAPYVLVVGAFYPHKNLERLCRIWERLAASEHLVLVGREDVFAHRLKARISSRALETKKIIFFGQASDEQLRSLYRGARFVLVPSLYEGVGLPGLEALMCGVPVVSSSESVMPEIYQSSALYIPVENDDRLEQALRHVLENHLEAVRPAPRPFTDERVRESFDNIFSKILEL